MWNSGSAVIRRSAAPSPIPPGNPPPAITYARWVCMTSFDRPVVPEVGIITATSSGPTPAGPAPPAGPPAQPPPQRAGRAPPPRRPGPAGGPPGQVGHVEDRCARAGLGGGGPHLRGQPGVGDDHPRLVLAQEPRHLGRRPPRGVPPPGRRAHPT